GAHVTALPQQFAGGLAQAARGALRGAHAPTVHTSSYRSRVPWGAAHTTSCTPREVRAVPLAVRRPVPLPGGSLEPSPQDAPQTIQEMTRDADPRRLERRPRPVDPLLPADLGGRRDRR